MNMNEQMRKLREEIEKTLKFEIEMNANVAEPNGNTQGWVEALEYVLGQIDAVSNTGEPILAEVKRLREIEQEWLVMWATLEELNMVADVRKNMTLHGFVFPTDEDMEDAVSNTGEPTVTVDDYHKKGHLYVTVRFPDGEEYAGLVEKQEGEEE